tara:strand:+ start:210 stop:563 length:354 start_codon:yes stop_codon:yes gene_type:complete
MSMKVNDKIYKRRIKKLRKFVERRLPRMTLKEFKDNTPRDKGNARINTKLKKKRNGFDIIGDYAYSGVIDRGEYPKNPLSGTGKTRNGYSTQAPQGITTPTGKFVDQEVRKFIKRIR